MMSQSNGITYTDHRFWEDHILKTSFHMVSEKNVKDYTFYLDEMPSHMFRELTKKDPFLELTVMATCFYIVYTYCYGERVSLAMCSHEETNQFITLATDICGSQTIQEALKHVREDLINGYHAKTSYADYYLDAFPATEVVPICGIQPICQKSILNQEVSFLFQWGTDQAKIYGNIQYHAALFDKPFVEGMATIMQLVLDILLSDKNIRSRTNGAFSFSIRRSCKS
jgi:hypothetical protein